MYKKIGKGKNGLLGHKHSKKTKEKMSKIAKEKGFGKGSKGKHHSVETREKMRKSQEGEKSWSWRGGLTPINKKIRQSLKFKLWREAVFKRDNWTCQNCKIRGGKLHPHHIKPFSKYPELRFIVDNGITLCYSCHLKKHLHKF